MVSQAKQIDLAIRVAKKEITLDYVKKYLKDDYDYWFSHHYKALVPMYNPLNPANNLNALFAQYGLDVGLMIALYQAGDEFDVLIDSLTNIINDEERDIFEDEPQRVLNELLNKGDELVVKSVEYISMALKSPLSASGEARKQLLEELEYTNKMNKLLIRFRNEYLDIEE